MESNWRQFCVPTEPPDQEGGESRTVISFDCGYGIAQVTSGMHVGETPDFDRERVAADPVYNLATGTRILATLLHEMARRDARYGLETMCIGGGQGLAAVFERVA